MPIVHSSISAKSNAQKAYEKTFQKALKFTLRISRECVHHVILSISIKKKPFFQFFKCNGSLQSINLVKCRTVTNSFNSFTSYLLRIVISFHIYNYINLAFKLYNYLYNNLCIDQNIVQIMLSPKIYTTKYTINMKIYQ